MHRLWSSLVEPILTRLDPKVVVEIGVARGDNTRNLLAWARARDATVHAIDPAPSVDLGVQAGLTFHRARSLDALPEIGPTDAVLIDGDHNWYTVFHELTLLDELAMAAGRELPLVLLHDVGWPYARRDLYYEPAAVPEMYRRPHARAGLVPGLGGVCDRGGFNAHLANAREEGGPQNGVLTAVEDFLGGRDGMRLLVVEGLHGLGVLVAEATLARRPELLELLERLEREDVLRAHLRAVERRRVELAAAQDLSAIVADQKARAQAAERAKARAELRRTAARADAAEADLRALATSPVSVEARPLRVLFVLPTESGGGSHSVLQEARGMRELGVDVQIAVDSQHREQYLREYPESDREGLFWFYESLDEVVAGAGRFDCAVATIFHSMRLVQMIVEQHPAVVPAYYVQDYEPWFFDEDSEWRRVAEESYALVPGTVVFAKTQWLCDLVRRRHGVNVHRVEPSLDTTVYFGQPRGAGGPVRVAAMIRPPTSYRGSERTLRVLRLLEHEFGKRVRLETFGSPETRHGVLRREQVGELLRGCDVFLDFSDWQAFGRTALEAAACGCAVVVPAAGGAPEHVEHRVTGLVVDTRDEDACFAAARELVKDDELRTRLREAGVERAARFSIRRAAVSELALLRGAVVAAAHRRTAELGRRTDELERRERALAQLAATAVDAVRRAEEAAREREQHLRGVVLQIRHELLYERLVTDVRAAVDAVVPAKATVAVATHGDAKFLRLGGRRAWHFPRLADGTYTAEQPVDAVAAIAQVDALVAAGARYLVFPHTAFWWLEHYAGLGEHLERGGLVHRDRQCRIYRLPRGRRRALAHEPAPLRKHDLYDALVGQVQRVVGELDGAVVVSKGDDRLLARRARHFPALPDGTYTGHHPADGADAVERLQRSGARYFVLPNTAFWWLDHYRELAARLDSGGRRIWSDDRCIVWDITGRRPGLVLRRRLARLQRRLPPAPELARAARLQLVAPAPATRSDEHGFDVPERHRRPPVERHRIGVDIVICIHNAPDDVRRCLESVLRHTTQPYSLLLVDDGSNAQTRRLVDAFVAERGATLIRNEQARGYTFAANQGLRASHADYVLLLNSDTVVTPDWLDRLVACAESDERIGIVGPLSNAATWQSVPEIIRDGEFARNALPPGVSEDELARRVAAASEPLYPRIGFLNGFCLLIRRRLLDEVGLFDEETFARGYGEENDLCVRARQAGWELAVADDTCVVHRVGRSYTEQRRQGLSKAANEVLLAKHGPELIEPFVELCRHDRVLEGIRARVAISAKREELLARGHDRWAGKHVALILPVHRPGGGANIVMHEAEAMWRMGVAVCLVNLERNRAGFLESFPDNRIPVVWARDESTVMADLRGYDAVVATWCESVYWLEPVPPGCVRGYYIQDFEPYFFEPDTPAFRMAWGSYTAYPDLVRVAKTEWDRQEVLERIGVDSFVGGATVDIDLQRPRPRRDPEWPHRPVRVLAMIRPSTPRRAPRLTMEVLRDVERKHGDAVEVVTFGCESDDRQFLELPRDFRWRNAGVINREQVAALVNEVDVFVDFSEFQAQGLTAMEAMAAGAAGVVPRRGGSVSFVRDGVNGVVVDTTSRDECRAALERLVTDHALRTRLQRQAIWDICEFFPEAGAFRTLEALLGGQEGRLRLLGDKHDHSYVPSYELADELHYRAVEATIAPFPGYLRPEDELKLFELASFVEGPVLELGTLYGRSTAIVASALKRAAKDVPFVSVDIEPSVQAEARRRLEKVGLADFVSLFNGTCEEFFGEHPDFRPALVFIDADHSYDGVWRDLEALRDHVPAGGLLLFHDFLDERNDDPSEPDYGVTSAIADSWVAAECQFGGTFGACGLFRRRVGPPAVVR